MFWLFIIPGILLALFAQWKVSSAYRKYSQVRNTRNLTGQQVAQILMRNEGLEHVGIEGVPGEMTDHYDPRAKVMRLSDGSSQLPSIASMAIVAHELGHAQQDKTGYAWLRVRSGIVGIANIGSNFGWLLIMVGMLLGGLAGSQFGFQVAIAGVILMAAGVAFSLVTLPVEFDASARAKDMLMRNGLVTAEEANGVKAVLDAAALTYVAAAAQAVMQLLYWVMVLSGARRSE